MSTTETVYEAMGWHSNMNPLFGKSWNRPGTRAVVGPMAYGLPDPLADTPEGDHEFMEIMRWAEGAGVWPDYTPEIVRGTLYWYVDNGSRTAQATTFKAAFLEALAAAIKGEQGTVPCACSPSDTDCSCAYDCDCRERFEHIYDTNVEHWVIRRRAAQEGEK